MSTLYTSNVQQGPQLYQLHYYSVVHAALRICKRFNVVSSAAVEPITRYHRLIQCNGKLTYLKCSINHMTSLNYTITKTVIPYLFEL